jgi:acetoin utilization protein AcuB
VGAWMTPNPRTIPSDVSVRSAFFAMRSQGIRHLIVVDNGHVEGIVTDRDLRRPDLTDEPDGWHDYYRLDEEYEVRHVMTTDVVSLTPGDSLEKATRIFTKKKFGAVPVVDRQGDLIGILSTHDLLRAFEGALEQAGSYLRRS